MTPNIVYIYIYMLLFIIYIIYILSMDGVQNYPYVNDGSIQFEKEGGGDHPVAWGGGHVLLAN